MPQHYPIKKDYILLLKKNAVYRAYLVITTMLIDSNPIHVLFHSFCNKEQNGDTIIVGYNNDSVTRKWSTPPFILMTVLFNGGIA